MRSRFIRLFLLYALLKYSYSRYFDACPSRKISIGACLAGLCPLGSECINNFCCKDKAVTTTPKSEEIEEFGKCKDGQDAIGECVSKLCPSGYICDENLCCGNQTIVTGASTTGNTKTSETIRAKTFKPFTNEPSTTKSSSKPNVTPEESMEIVDIVDFTTDTTIPQIDEDNEEDSNEDEDGKTTYPTESTTVDMTEIESIRNSFKVLKSKVSKENGEDPTTTARSIGHKVEEEQKEVKSSLYTSTSTTTPTTSYSTTNVITTTAALVTSTTQQSQICPVGEPIGECISEQCPEGHTCYRNACCIVTPQINCTDALNGCLHHLCDKRGYKEFTTTNCARTCARCHVSELAAVDIIGCRDRRNDCKEWAAEGFCESALYSTRQKLKFCGKSCKLC